MLGLFSSIIRTLFLPLRETVYAGLVKLFAEALELFTHAVSARCRRPQNGVLGVHPSGVLTDGGRRTTIQDCGEDEREQSTPLLQ